MRAVLFLLPLAVIFGVPLLVLWLGGELTDPDTVVARQARGDRLVLHGPAYTNSAMYVKARHIAAQHPQVMALGNSRTMQFRRDFFLPEVSFYNAGGSAVRIMHFRAFLAKLPPESLPQILIIATDIGFFNESFDKVERDTMDATWVRERMTTHATANEVFRDNWQTVWQAIREGKVRWSRVFSLEGLGSRIGLNALCNEQGFRNDGSYLYGGLELDITDPRHRDHAFANTLKIVARGGGRFAWGSTVSEGALRETDALLDFCRARKIEVIGFFPPHAHAVWAAMQKLGDKYAFVPKLDRELRARFAARGFEFYDFNDFASFGAPDDDAIDGYHGTERTYLRLFVSMLEQGSRLNSCASLPALRAVLASSTRHTNLFPDRP